MAVGGKLEHECERLLHQGMRCCVYSAAVVGGRCAVEGMYEFRVLYYGYLQAGKAWRVAWLGSRVPAGNIWRTVGSCVGLPCFYCK